MVHKKNDLPLYVYYLPYIEKYPKMDNEEVKKNIERIRQDKGVKIETICADLGITRQAWYNYLSGGFSLATLNKISEALKVEVYEILKPSDDNSQDKPQKTPEILCPYCGKPLQIIPADKEIF